MISARIYSKNIVNNKIVFVVKNFVFLTIFFSIVCCNFEMLNNSFLMMFLIVPSLKFEKDSEELDNSDNNIRDDNNISTNSNKEDAEEEVEEDDSNIVNAAVSAMVRRRGTIALAIGCGTFFTIFLLAALVFISDPITQLAKLVLKEDGLYFAEPEEVTPPDNSNSDSSDKEENGGPVTETPKEDSTPSKDDSKEEKQGFFSWLFGVVSDFFEKSKNFLIFGEYNTLEKVAKNKINEFAKRFYEDYYVKIDVGLLVSTLYYDGTFEDEIDTDNDEIPDSNPKLASRIEYLQKEGNFEKIASLALKITEAKYICKEEVTSEGISYVTQFVSSQEVDVIKKNTTCNESTITRDLNDPNQYVYTYDYEYDKDNYFIKLARSEVMDGLFPEVITKEDKESVVSDIQRGYSIWYMLYGDDFDDGKSCVAPGNIPNNFLNYMRTPVNYPYRITSKYGPRNDPFTGNRGVHNGVDVVPTKDDGIYAAASGKVALISYSEEEGNYVIIAHNFNEQTVYSAYKHLANNSIVVKVGQEVNIGDYIARMGATGKVTGAHLHFTLYMQKTDPVNGEVTRNYFNPENLFSSADNYEYECSDDIEVGSCSINGGIAVYANRRRYSFNLLRAIINGELNYYKGSSDLIVDLDIEGLKKLLNSSNSKEAKTAKEQIRFDDRQVLVGGYWLPFSDIFRDQSSMRRVIDLMAAVSDKAYEHVYMGVSLLKGSDYKNFEFKSAKEMYETFRGNKSEQIKWTVEKVVSDNPYLYNLLKTFDIGPEYIIREGDTPAVIARRFLISEERLRSSTNINNIRLTKGETLKFHDKTIVLNLLVNLMTKNIENKENYVDYIYSKYLEYMDDPKSTTENYLNECLIIEKPGWADCYTYENKSGCQNNLRQYRAKATELVNEAPTAIGKRVLLYGLSIWGKVRYCGWCSKTNIHCTDIYPPSAGPELAGKPGASAYKYSFLTRCSDSFPISLWYYEGFNPKWGIVHSYNYNDPKTGEYNEGVTAGIAGLDCEGFVTWTMNHAFGTFKSKNNSSLTSSDSEVPLYGTGTTGGSFKAVMGGACRNETDYTTYTYFGEKGFKTKNIASQMTPGDVLCDYKGGEGGRHVMIYMGYDDLDGDGIANNKDRIYFLHSSNGSMGINIWSTKVSNPELDRYVSFFTYK